MFSVANFLLMMWTWVMNVIFVVTIIIKVPMHRMSAYCNESLSNSFIQYATHNYAIFTLSLTLVIELGRSSKRFSTRLRFSAALVLQSFTLTSLLYWYRELEANGWSFMRLNESHVYADLHAFKLNSFTQQFIMCRHCLRQTRWINCSCLFWWDSFISFFARSMWRVTRLSQVDLQA